MKRIILLVLALSLAACTTVKYIPIKGETITKDSIIIETKIDTLEVKLPPERVRDWTGLLDTLRLQTGYAYSTSWVDTTKGILTGTLVNKETPLDVYVPSTHTLEKKDSIIYKEIPVPVEKIEYRTPKWPWYSLILNIIGFLLVGFSIYLKVKKLN